MKDGRAKIQKEDKYFEYKLKDEYLISGTSRRNMLLIYRLNINNFQNYWSFGLSSSSDIVENRKHEVSEN
jgi:hypothetical protein